MSSIFRAFQAWQKLRATDHSSYCNISAGEDVVAFKNQNDLTAWGAGVSIECKSSAREISVCPAKMELIGSKR